MAALFSVPTRARRRVSHQIPWRHCVEEEFRAQFRFLKPKKQQPILNCQIEPPPFNRLELLMGTWRFILWFISFTNTNLSFPLICFVFKESALIFFVSFFSCGHIIYEVRQSLGKMADIPGYMRACLQPGKLAFLAILVSGGVVLQILVGCLIFLLNCSHGIV